MGLAQAFNSTPSDTPSPGTPAPQPQQDATPAPAARPQVPLESAPIPDKATPPKQGLGQHIGSLLGNLFGSPVSYQPEVGPDGKPTGRSVPVKEKATPGQLFKHLLGGALLGGAIASENPKGGFLGGVARGGAGVAQHNKEEIQQNRENSRKDVADMIEKQKSDREDQLAQATIAHYHMANVVSINQLQMQRQDHIDAQNDINNGILHQAYELGAKPASLVSNGKVLNPNGTMTAAEFGKAYTKDPSILKAPDNYFRVLSKEFDTTGLTWNPEKSAWNDQDGKPVNPGDHIRVTAVDVPANVMKRPIPTKGSVINKAFGSKIVDDDAEYPISLLDNLSIAKDGLMGQLEKAKVDQAREAVKVEAQKMSLELQLMQTNATKENRAITYDQLRIYEKQYDDLSGRLKSPELAFAPDEKKQVEGQLKDTKTALDGLTKQLQDSLVPVPSPNGKKTTTAPAAPTKVDITAPVNAPSSSATSTTRGNGRPIPANQVDMGLVRAIAAKGDKVTVQIPGQNPGQIDVNQLQQFLIDNPKASIIP